jgi:hypothetical protein
LRVCCCGAPSLMRGRVSHLQLLLVLVSAVILRSESHETHDRILLSQIRDSPNLEGQVPVFISPGERVAYLYPQVLGSFSVASYDSQGYGGGIPISLHAGRLLAESSNRKHRFQQFFIVVSCVHCRENVYIGRSVVKAVSSGTTIPVFRCHITISMIEWHYFHGTQSNFLQPNPLLSLWYI